MKLMMLWMILFRSLAIMVMIKSFQPGYRPFKSGTMEMRSGAREMMMVPVMPEI